MSSGKEKSDNVDRGALGFGPKVDIAVVLYKFAEVAVLAMGVGLALRAAIEERSKQKVVDVQSSSLTKGLSAIRQAVVPEKQ